MSNFQADAVLLRDELVRLRRDFHSHPEPAFQETRTASIVAQTLRQLGLEVWTQVGKTGVVGLLRGDSEGPTVMVRCDMDALPIQEENVSGYASIVPDTMHACGHDGHTAIGLTVARMLNERREELRGTVKFVFQPAEEIGQGALAMIADGALDDPVPEVCFGLHLWNELPIGQVGVSGGAVMAGADSFHARIKGQGSHGAMPHLGHDPVLTAAHSIIALQSVVSRNISPLDAAVISVTQMQAGSAVNIIPDDVTLSGTIRTFSTSTREAILGRIQQIMEGTANTMNCALELTFEQLSRPVINDTHIANRLADVVQTSWPDLICHRDFRTLAAEDMAYFLERVPGVFFFVGSANADRGLDVPHHHPRFDFDEDALVTGAAILAAAVANYTRAET